MKRILLMLCATLLLGACNKTNVDNADTAATPPGAADEVAIIETKLGKIVIELDDTDAPKTCANFRKLIREHYYNGTTFHRVIPGFMIQGGDPISKADPKAMHLGSGGPSYTIPAEIKQPNRRGTVATARTGDDINPRKESSGSQFFINVNDNQSLDGGYTVFGRVIRGMDVADQIVNVPRDERDNPREAIRMEIRLGNRTEQ